MTESINVVLIGGGYSGVMAANRLTQRADVAVTLVNPRPEFVERVRLHQLVGRTHDAVRDFREVLAESVRLVIDTVTRIDAAECALELASGGTISYDYLVYAVGSDKAAARVPGAAEFARTMASLEDARELRAVVDSLPAAAPITVVGGGPLGIEMAAELGERGRAVTLVCGGQLGPYLHPSGRRSVAKALARLGVRVLDGPGAKVVEVTAEAVRLADGRELASAVTIWAAGFAASDLAARSGLSVDVVGRLLADETLTSVDDERIVATGDAASPSGMPLRMSCQAALPLGSHAADTVLSRIAGESPAEFTRGIAAMCVSLGRSAGVFQLARFDDTAIRLHVPGRPGAVLKEAACASPIDQLAKEAHKPGSHSWIVKDSRRVERVAAQRAAGLVVSGRAG
ncbi:FAD-dependent oxidoreductase [Sinomonas sp. ASV322]|uniref:NAD(P)/FAD-dependent oxidoreductase n=1 Tax=Sinomonas sp. ASV322 TaxID=3041920 RepID=UPI0027DC2E74|nr:FAD-dependent oxidoreductase [Sinomonas sp. ASV322]MDQ4504316.1 FAD-dependent oxidoreductase [Sinomonas sp. ASV322]